MDAGLRTYREQAERNVRDQLIMDHLSYVKNVLGRLVVELPDGIDVDNLESAGILGLVEAAGRFDSDRGVQFKTFAYTRIRGAILDELRRNCPLPQSILRQWSLIRDAWKELTEANSESLAKATGLSVRQVEETLAAIRFTRPEVWREDLQVKNSCRGELGSVEHQDQQQRLAEAIEQLSEQSRVVVTLYHLEQMTLKEIGIVIGRSESRVSRILAAAELELRGRLQESI